MIKRGFSLTELLVVVGIIALLMSVGIPAAKKLSESLESSDGVRSVINAALCNARATAIKEQKYAGVRFQFGADGRQYMVLVLHDPAEKPTNAEIANNPDKTGTGLASGFRVMSNRKSTALPASVGVMDCVLVSRTLNGNNSITFVENTVNIANPDLLFDSNDKMTDVTSFSIIFSPAGKLVTHEVRIRNKYGKISSDTYDPTKVPYDDTFNTEAIVSGGLALLYQDDLILSGFGPGPEYSRKSFLIYNVEAFKKINPAMRWSGYLQDLYLTGRIFVNPHSGEIVNR